MDRQADDARAKLDLPFILNASSRPRRQGVARGPATGVREQSAPSPAASAATSEAKQPPSREEKKKKRECTVEGCDNYIVHKGLCCRHGGGKKCAHDGCNTSAKHKGLCWKHGGSVLCKMNKCTRKAKARGLCWSHGGGTKCRQEECAKVAVSNGFCWAHGGGKRCGFEGCIKPGYERTASLCPQHYEELSERQDDRIQQELSSQEARGERGEEEEGVLYYEL